MPLDKKSPLPAKKVEVPQQSKSLEKKTDINCFFLVVDGRYTIDKNVLLDSEKQIYHLPDNGEHVYLIIQTYGGDAFSAVKIIRLLQKKFKKISTIVPSHAMSAGTLISLGTDEIYMTYKSVLGPLDLPMKHPKDGSRISALDVQSTMTTIATLSDTVAKQRYNSIINIEDCEIGNLDAVKIAFSTATEFVKPIVEHIDPYFLHKCYRELKIGLKYAIDLLQSRMMKGNIYQASDTAMRLVNDYPAHEFGIFSDTAKDVLHLNVYDLDTLEEWKTIKPIFDEIDKTKYYKISYKVI